MFKLVGEDMFKLEDKRCIIRVSISSHLPNLHSQLLSGVLAGGSIAGIQISVSLIRRWEIL